MMCGSAQRLLMSPRVSLEQHNRPRNQHVKPLLSIRTRSRYPRGSSPIPPRGSNTTAVENTRPRVFHHHLNLPAGRVSPERGILNNTALGLLSVGMDSASIRDLEGPWFRYVSKPSHPYIKTAATYPSLLSLHSTRMAPQIPRSLYFRVDSATMRDIIDRRYRFLLKPPQRIRA
jgi:hypothetical protein